METFSGPDVSAVDQTLDPLTPREIASAVQVLRVHRPLSDRVRFVSISTLEPNKGTSGADAVRGAEVVLFEAESQRTIEAKVDLDSGVVVGWRELDGVQPQMTADEFVGVEAAVRRAPEFVAAVCRRGIDDVSTVDVDPVAAGFHGRPEEGRPGERRLARVLAYVRPTPGGNAYARPLAGIFGLVDVDTGELVYFEDREPVALPPGDGEFRADKLVSLRDDVREIHISQPDGPSFSVDGQQVRWQKWRCDSGSPPGRVWCCMTSRYEDQGQPATGAPSRLLRGDGRALCGSGSVLQAPLDIGEFIIGTLTNSLTLGCDCLGAIHYFDAACVFQRR